MNTKFFLFPFFIIMFLVLSGCERSPDIESTKYYDGNNFRFSYPGNWEITDDYMIGNIHGIEIESPGAALVIIQDWPKEEFGSLTLKEFAYIISSSAQEEVVIGSLSNGSFEDIQTSYSSGSIKGIRETFSITLLTENIPHIRDTYLKRSKSNNVILMTQVATEDYKTVEPGFVHILDSFNFK